MTKQEFKVSYILSVIMMIVLAFIDWRLTTGYAVGAAFSFLLYKRNERYVDRVLEQRKSGRAAVFGHFMNNYALMAIALLFGALIPEYFNIFGVALGLFLLKTAVIINTVINRKESKE